VFLNFTAAQNHYAFASTIMYDQKQAGVNDLSEIVMWQLLYRVPDTLNAALQKYTMNQFSSRKKRANF